MSTRIELTTPVGRLVMGSLYRAQTTDAENKPLTYRAGPNAGQPRVDYFFAVAIPKQGEKHWSETEWGKKIWNVGHTGFPNGQAQSPTFAWKVKDGDSTVPNRVGKRPCDQEGFAGHWVLNFNSGFAPSVWNSNGHQRIVEENAVNLGDYVQVFCTVSDNESQQQPGIYLNHSMVALAGYGQRISSGADPKAVGFGQGVTLPAGASATPIGGFTPPATPAATAPAYVPPAPNAAPAPYTPILNPAPAVTPPAPVAAPAPVPSERLMTEAAKGIPYEQYVQSGWTDEMLIKNGLMTV